MAGKKRILVVDDHFEMLEFLRSMLEMSNSDYQVTAAPSAEEGLLEVRRMETNGATAQRGASVPPPIDLLITDVRLPGMSGFDLVRKARALRPDLPVLMITAYASAQGRQEAENLGVYRYFEKPLDTDALLAAVHVTLTADDSQATAAASEPATAKGAHRAEREHRGSPNESLAQEQAEAHREKEATDQDQVADEETAAHAEIRARLAVLLSDTGAIRALLADEEGTILFRAGTTGDYAVEHLARLLARSVADSFELAEALQSAEPFTIQYQAGERVDLYTANIGRHYFLSLLFDAQARRGRIGTVWVFAQRAIKELRRLLPEAGQAREDSATPEAREQKAAQHNEPAAQQRAKAPPPESAPMQQAQPVDPVKSPEKVNGSVASNASKAGSEDDMALFELMEEADELSEMDLDEFWEEATADAGNGDMDGLSFEEAVERGLLPPELL